MRLTVVGSSDAFNAGGRGHSCYLLEGSKSGPLMVDFGGTALMGLRQLDRDPTELHAVVITHLHGDHFSGLPFLFIDGMFNVRRDQPLHILGPPGVEQRVNDLFHVTYGDLDQVQWPFELRFSTLEPGRQSQLSGLTIQAFAADHIDPPGVAMCLRITEAEGKSVAFSGDTAMCPGLLQAADGVDLLVADCSCLRQPCGRHSTWEQWLDVLPELNAGQVVLTHLDRVMRAQVPQLTEQVPSGVSLSFADDGLTVQF